MLVNEGFTRVFSMNGGIKGWEGFAAEGPPEAGMVLFSRTRSLHDYLAVSWALEEGTRRFYETLAGDAHNPDIAAVYRKLSAVEKKHQDLLHGMHRQLEKETLSPRSKDALHFPPSGDDLAYVMENGSRTDEAVRWGKGRPVTEVLEYAMGMEAQLLDLYSRIASVQDTDENAGFFRALAAEEKAHYNRLAELLHVYRELA